MSYSWKSKCILHHWMSLSSDICRSLSCYRYIHDSLSVYPLVGTVTKATSRLHNSAHMQLSQGVVLRITCASLVFITIWQTGVANWQVGLSMESRCQLSSTCWSQVFLWATRLILLVSCRSSTTKWWTFRIVLLILYSVRDVNIQQNKISTA